MGQDHRAKCDNLMLSMSMLFIYPLLLHHHHLHLHLSLSLIRFVSHIATVCFLRYWLTETIWNMRVKICLKYGPIFVKTFIVFLTFINVFYAFRIYENIRVVKKWMNEVNGWIQMGCGERWRQEKRKTERNLLNEINVQIYLKYIGWPGSVQWKRNGKV